MSVAKREAMDRGSRLRRWLPRLAMVTLGVIVAVAVAELALRWVRPQLVLIVDRGLYAPAPAPLRYRLQPGFHGRITNRLEFDTAVSIDQHGLRGAEVCARDRSRLRVLALGDSFTFGVGVEDDQPWIVGLAGVLGAAGFPAEGLNAGAPGYGVPDAADWLEVYGAEIDPDLVLLAVFPGNDLYDAAPGGTKMEVVDGELRRAGERSDVKRWLYYHSHLFAFVKAGLPPALDRRLRALLHLDEPRPASSTSRSPSTTRDPISWSKPGSPRPRPPWSACAIGARGWERRWSSSSFLRCRRSMTPRGAHSSSRAAIEPHGSIASVRAD
jgi:lysophospholipase L1-like esterase